MKPWWITIPGRREYEIENLKAAGATILAEDDSIGLLVLELDFSCEGQAFELRAIFPPEYPCFKPDVYSRSATYRRHFQPISRGLCLLGQSTHQWNPQYTLARHLAEQLPEFIREQNRATATPTQGEPQAEPASQYFRYNRLGGIAFNSAMRISQTLRGGTFSVNARTVESGNGIGIAGIGIQGVLSKVRHCGTEVGRWPYAIPNSFDSIIRGTFIITGKPAFIEDPEDQLNALRVMHPHLAKPNWQSAANGMEIALQAILFDEEVGQGRQSPTWMFFLLQRPKGAPRATIERIRGIRAGEADFGARVPGVQALRDKTVLVVGCGAIGAPIALELARNGVGKLRLIDPDHAEFGPSVRWPLGLSAAGMLKVLALGRTIVENYPMTRVENLVVARIGGAFDPNTLSAASVREGLQHLDDAFLGSNLLIDATAEVGVQHYLSAWARSHGIPYIYASATPGAVGGQVGRFVPGSTHGCWMCAQHALHNSKSLPEPPHLEGDAGEVLPAGCQHATFTGASYDLHEVSLQAIRMAVQALSGPSDSAFARLAFDADLGIPQWAAHKVPLNPECTECR